MRPPKLSLPSEVLAPNLVTRPVLRGWAHFKRLFQRSDLLFILLSAGIGLLAGVMVALMTHLAHLLQSWLFGFDVTQRLSAQPSLEPWRLMFLPLGGLILAGLSRAFPKRSRKMIDVIEANALYGGRIPLRDSLLVSLRTLVSNGFGASVGLEAAYAQMGGGVASRIGQWLELKRSSLRTLVGGGAGAAIGAAFGAPLAGTFYAFETVLGGYTVAQLAPVAAASLAAVLAAQLMGAEPFIVAETAGKSIAVSGYLLYALLGIICAVIGIFTIRSVSWLEAKVRLIPVNEIWRPFVGGVLLMPVAYMSPQALSAGHGAMGVYLEVQDAVIPLLLAFALKLLASVISLGFAFRGGLFFASLYLGSLLGSAFAQVVNMVVPGADLSVINAALVGMAALAVAVVGGPMTMSLLVLEVTHDFALTAAVVTASLFASAIVRQLFGYSFSTWRLHLRGESVRTARDIGWMRSLTAEKLMRKNQATMWDTATVDDLRAQVPLGSTSRVMIVNADGCYVGLIPTAEAYIGGLDPHTPLSVLARQGDVSVRPEADITAIKQLFSDLHVDEVAVVDTRNRLVGMLTERYVSRRYLEELERSQREFFGEG